MRVKRWESKIPLRQTKKAGEGWVDYRTRTSKDMRTMWRKMKLPTMAEKNAEKVWKTWLGLPTTATFLL